jgi:rod shape determining protein RodA
MSYRRNNIAASVDWFTIGIYLILVIAGWFSIYAATYNYDNISMVDLSGRAGMQMVWIISSLAIALAIMLIDSTWFEAFSVWIYLLMILLLIATIFIAPDIKGSRSWLVLGPVRIQPAEFAKFATALIVAKVMGFYRFNVNAPKNMFLLVGLILLPMLLIVMQHETGSALVFLAFFLVLYREGMPGAVLFSGFSAALFFVLTVRFSDNFWKITPVGEILPLIFIIVFAMGMLYIYSKGRKNLKYVVYVAVGVLAVGGIIAYFVTFNWVWAAGLVLAFIIVFLTLLFLKFRSTTYIWIVIFTVCSIGFSYSVDYLFEDVLEPHQKIRIEVALGMVDDPSGAGYNVNQSKIAIGSGGFVGKGYLNGTQTKLKYVPEQDTDFIFCTIGEEKGFLGSLSVILLFVVLILRLIYLAERQRTPFNRIYGYLVACIFFFHLAVNIGMVIGITPVIGIPLPFFSYGGSSLWSFTILLFIFLRLNTPERG